MKTLWSVPILLLFCSCSGSAPVSPPVVIPPPAAPTVQAVAAPTPEELASAKAFFEKLDDKYFELHSDPKTLSESERAGLVWLNKVIKRAGESPVGSFSYRLKKGKTGDPNNYAFVRHAGQSFPKLDPAKTYIQVQYKPEHLACPEYHGVIDPDGPVLLSFWTEGG